MIQFNKQLQIYNFFYFRNKKSTQTMIIKKINNKHELKHLNLDRKILNNQNIAQKLQGVEMLQNKRQNQNFKKQQSLICLNQQRPSSKYSNRQFDEIEIENRVKNRPLRLLSLNYQKLREIKGADSEKHTFDRIVQLLCPKKSNNSSQSFKADLVQKIPFRVDKKNIQYKLIDKYTTQQRGKKQSFICKNRKNITLNSQIESKFKKADDQNKLNPNLFTEIEIEKQKIQNIQLENIENKYNQKQNQIQNCKKTNNQKKIKSYENQFQSSIINLIVYPFCNLKQRVVVQTKSEDKRDVSVQTYHNDEQYFDFLTYKRKKSQFQKKFKEQFNQLEFVCKDRETFKIRMQAIKLAENKGPNNERETRVFSIKTQLNLIQNQLGHWIQKTSQCFQNLTSKIIEQNQKTHLNIQKKLQTSLKYIHLLEFLSEKYLPAKHLRIAKRIITIQKKKDEKLMLQQRRFYTKINQSIRDNENVIQTSNLQQKFQQYKKSMNEYKILLQNCFNHIKTIPQLCYQLYGSKTSNKYSSINIWEKQHIQFPKCMSCLNFEWKAHMLIEKNILMQSVLKVFQQLLK